MQQLHKQGVANEAVSSRQNYTTIIFPFPSPYSNPVNHNAFLWGLLYRNPVCESPRLLRFPVRMLYLLG